MVPVANPYYDPENAPWEYKDMPGTPQPSMGMEHYNDTPIVNGTAYPVAQVQPKSYRMRILNAANDRFFNLQMYVADGSVVTDDGRRNTEVKMIPARGSQEHAVTRVFRFYNFKKGVHFYTADRGREGQHAGEPQQDVQVEGVAYSLNSAPGGGNDTPLYRFYNMKTGVHFYTASEAEKNSIIANLSTIFRYEGIAYNVALNASRSGSRRSTASST